jgi:cyclophilin family peptidyl-prolyl cis-trans isomerase
MAELTKQKKRRTFLRRLTTFVVIAAIVVAIIALNSHGAKKTVAGKTTTTAKGATTTTSAATTTTPPTTAPPTTASTATTTASQPLAGLPAAPASLPDVAPSTPAQQTADLAASKAAGCPSSTSTRVNSLTWKSAPPLTINTSQDYTATFKTDAGNFTVTLDPKIAPQTVNSEVFLIQHNFYNCVVFHRVIPQFVIQGGDPTGTGDGGPGYTIPDEYPKSGTSYPLASLAMANTGQPNTGGSQFFIITGSQGEQLPDSYTLFGQVTSGFNTIAQIAADSSSSSGSTGTPTFEHRMLSVTVAPA